MPVLFDVDRATDIVTDGGEAGIPDPGDTLRTRVTIENTGDENATNTTFHDNFFGSTLTGDINISPIAFDDAFTAVGNTVLRVGGAANIGSGPSSQVSGNLLDNDVGSSTEGTGVITGDDMPGFTVVTVTNGVSAGGGTFNIFADGSFNYVNQAGDTGTDSFEYTIRDAGLDGIAGNADDLTSTATVTITLSEQVWYVDSVNGSDVTGTGTSANPFASVAPISTGGSADGLDDAADYIYVQGSATGTVVLETGQLLFGQGAELDVGGFSLASAGTNSDLTGSSGFTVTLAGSNVGNNTIAGIDINGVGGITGSTFGTLTVSNATLDTSGQALNLNAGTVTGGGFTSTNSDGGAFNVCLFGVDGTLVLGSGALSGATGDAFFVSGGTAGITYSGSITKSSAGGDVVDISTHGTGAIVLSGAINASGGSGGIRLVNNTSGDIDFTNSVVNLNTGTVAGVTFTNNTVTGADVSFTGGNLNIDTSTGAGILATNVNTNAGSLIISGANNVIDRNGGSGNAVFIDGVASNVTLLHVNATASSTGTLIYVKDNGATGSFTITGTGSTAGSGGTLNGSTGSDGTNAAGIGIYLEDANNISLSNLNLVGLYQNFGIRGVNVDDFTLRDSTLNGTYGTSIGLQEAAVRFGTQADSANGLTGIGLFEGNNISGGVYDNVSIFNNAAGSSTVTFQDSANDAAQIGHNGLTGNDGILFEIRNGHNGTLTVNGVTFTGARGDMVQSSVQGTGTMTATITNNTFHNTHGDITPGGGGITISGGQNPSNYNLTYNVSNNSFRGAEGSAIFISTIGTTGNISGVIANNTIGVNDANRPEASVVQATTGASGNGNGIDVRHEKFSGAGTFNHAVRIDGNTITDVTGSGIYLRSNNQGSGTGRLEATVTNNIIEEVGDFTFGGISVIAGGAGAGDIGLLGLALSGNTVNLDNTSGADGDNNAILIDQNSSSSLIYVPGYAPTATGGRGEARPPAGGTASAELSAFWDPPANTLTNGEFPNAIGAFVDATLVYAVNGSAFVLPVPLLAAGVPDAGLGWEDLLDGPLNVNPTEPDQTADESTAPGAPDEAGTDTSTVVDDGVLSQAELDLIVDAAIARWEAAGASEDQLAAMRATQVSVSDLGGLMLGASNAGTIVVDDNAAGWRWFVDATPGDDAEYAGSGTVLTATDPSGEAGTRMDLLTVIMHELGHQVGLEDSFATGDTDELMYGMISAGQRRLPGSDDLAAATGIAVTGAFAISPINLGTLPAGQTVTIEWLHTIDTPAEDGLVGGGGQSFVDSDQTGEVASLSEVVAVDGLSLGDLVFDDVDFDGIYTSGTDTGIAGVTLSLFADTNNDGDYDAGTDLAVVFQDNNSNGTYEQGIDTPLAAGSTGAGVVQHSATTDASGNYSFDFLAPGDYIVVVDAANFNSGNALEGTAIWPTTAADPDDNVDNDNNGEVAGAVTATRAIRLDYDQEPTAGAGNDTNLTLDLAFAQLNDAPVNSLGGSIGTGEDAVDAWLSGMSITDPDADPANDDIVVTFDVEHGTLDIDTSVAGGVTAGDVTGDDTGTIVVTATLDEINATLAANNGLTYTPDTNFNGSDTLTVTSNDQGNTGLDPGLTGDGSSEEDVDTRTISVSATNDAPTVIGDGTEEAASIVEDTPSPTGQTVSSLFSGQYSDAADAQFGVGNPTGSSPGAFSGIAVVANGSSAATGQWQYFNTGTSTWVDVGAVAADNALLIGAGTSIRFNPAQDFNGAAPTLTVHLIDNSLGFGITFGQHVDISGVGATGGTTAYSTATVVLSQTVTPDGTIEGTSGDDTLTGTPLVDVFLLHQGGDDTVTGLASDDGFYFGGAFTAADSVDGGDGTLDQVGLQGDYSAGLTFGANSFVSIEMLVLLPGDDTRFGDTAGNFYDYDLTTIDANVGAGQLFAISFNTLRAGEDVTFDGSAETDGAFLTYGGFGDDDLTGGAGDDGFYFGEGRFGASDVLDGGGGTMDQLGLQGDHTIVFGAGQLAGIEMIVCLTANDARFNGNGAALYNYDLTMDEGNLANGEVLVVSANQLIAGESLTFDGSAETDGGRYVVYGGDGTDVLTGGAGADELWGRGGADTLTGGDGNDTFFYSAASHSAPAGEDSIEDFTAGDLIGLAGIDAITGGSDDAFSFVGNAAFSNTAGELRAVLQSGADWLVEGDVNGDGVADFALLVTVTGGHTITGGDFIL